MNVVMDYIPDTAYRVMKQYLRMKQMVPDLLNKLYAYQLLRGIGYIHAKGICHRDIKQENLLCSTPAAHCDVVLGDFGLALTAQDMMQLERWTFGGSPAYLSPEVYLEGVQSHKSDSWAAGIVVYTLISGDSPLAPFMNCVFEQQSKIHNFNSITEN